MQRFLNSLVNLLDIAHDMQDSSIKICFGISISKLVIDTVGQSDFRRALWMLVFVQPLRQIKCIYGVFGYLFSPDRKSWS